MSEVALFVAALFVVPWIIGFVLPPPSGTLSSFLAAFLPVVWSPTILAIGFIVVRNGLRGLRNELTGRLAYKSGSAPWLLFAGVVPVLAVTMAVFSARVLGGGAPFIELSALMQVIILQLITGAVGEELGWRGFLLPRLGRLTGTTAASWIMGVLWSLWHVPAFYDPTLPHYFMPMPVVLPFVAFFGVFMGFMFNRAGGSVPATMAAHLSLNIMTALGGASLTSSVFWGVLALLFGVTAISMTLKSRTHISGRRPEYA
jgi:CAAX protease family protein